MANLINNNFNFYKLKTYRGEYWDIILNKDIQENSHLPSNLFFDDNLIAYFDLSDKTCFYENGLISNNNYKWDNAISIGYSLNNIGYTSFDNGLIQFERDKINNSKFVELYTKSNIEIPKDDLNLKLHFVSGCTLQYDYDYLIKENSIKLNGGFLQGFFKTEDCKYQVLPSEFNNNDVLTLEFTLKPCDGELTKRKHLNDKYPNNKGIFWYIGTRAENKWIYLYDKKDNELSYDDYIEDSDIDVDDYIISCFNDKDGDLYFDNEYVEEELDITDKVYKTEDNSFTIGLYEEYADYKNPFLLFNRTNDGFNVGNWTEDSSVRYVGLKNDFDKNNNLFLLMNRTNSGYTVSTIEGLKKEYDNEYDVNSDLYSNALAFRITDDGEIGYRYLVKNCNNENGYEIMEGYSKKNIVEKYNWNHVTVKIMFLYNLMQLKFYVNGNLVFITKLLPKLMLRELNEIYSKQETVPFNMSLGGGTQGLIETILPNYMLNPYRTYPLEKNFAGTFYGEISSFKIYNSNLSFEEINSNFKHEFNKILK